MRTYTVIAYRNHKSDFATFNNAVGTGCDAFFASTPKAQYQYLMSTNKGRPFTANSVSEPWLLFETHYKFGELVLALDMSQKRAAIFKQTPSIQAIQKQLIPSSYNHIDPVQSRTLIQKLLLKFRLKLKSLNNMDLEDFMSTQFSGPIENYLIVRYETPPDQYPGGKFKEWLYFYHDERDASKGIIVRIFKEMSRNRTYVEYSSMVKRATAIQMQNKARNWADKHGV